MQETGTSESSGLRIPLARTPAVVVLTSSHDGDVGLRSSEPAEVVEARRQRLVAGRWRVVRQCHGDEVVVVAPDEPCESREADALVTTFPGAPIAVFSADCGVIAMASPEGVVAAVHAGWRGLLAGVIERAAEAMFALGASEIVALVGPCIGPECYEFSAVDLAPIEARLGASVASRTASGALALDLRAGVHRALEASAVTVVAEVASCTACQPGWFSWRARSDTGRQALVVVQAP